MCGSMVQVTIPKGSARTDTVLGSLNAFEKQQMLPDLFLFLPLHMLATLLLFPTLSFLYPSHPSLLPSCPSFLPSLPLPSPLPVEAASRSRMCNFSWTRSGTSSNSTGSAGKRELYTPKLLAVHICCQPQSASAPLYALTPKM